MISAKSQLGRYIFQKIIRLLIFRVHQKLPSSYYVYTHMLTHIDIHSHPHTLFMEALLALFVSIFAFFFFFNKWYFCKFEGGDKCCVSRMTLLRMTIQDGHCATILVSSTVTWNARRKKMCANVWSSLKTVGKVITSGSFWVSRRNLKHRCVILSQDSSYYTTVGWGGGRASTGFSNGIIRVL